jgi:Holliday junction resolvase RusA-like endonuclease
MTVTPLTLPGIPEPEPSEHHTASIDTASWRLEIRVDGMPSTKGSMRAYTVRRKDGGVGARVAHGTSAQEQRLRTWEHAVRATASLALGELEITRRPVLVDVTFRLPRPAGHYGSGKNSGRLKAGAPRRHRTKPDGDKLLRAVLDAMTGTVYADDGQVCEASYRKLYADEHNPVGATIVVEVVE